MNTARENETKEEVICSFHNFFALPLSKLLSKLIEYGNLVLPGLFACSTSKSTSSPVLANKNVETHSCVFVQTLKGKIKDFIINNSFLPIGGYPA